MSADTHLDHKIERDVVRENLKRRHWGYSAIELVLRNALDALDRKDARIAALEAELKEAKSAEDYALGVELRFVEKIADLEAELAIRHEHAMRGASWNSEDCRKAIEVARAKRRGI